MKLFLIYQEQNSGYDTYDSAVVVAPDEETARRMCPDGGGSNGYNPWTWTAPEYVSVNYLGEAAEGLPEGFVCKSYNGG